MVPLASLGVTSILALYSSYRDLGSAFSYTRCTYRIHISVLILFLLLEERVTRTIKWNAPSMPPCLARVEMLTTLFFPYPINHHHAVLPSCCYVAHSARSTGNKTCPVCALLHSLTHFCTSSRTLAPVHALLHPSTHFCNPDTNLERRRLRKEL
jgi:hypothetical protein